MNILDGEKGVDTDAELCVLVELFKLVVQETLKPVEIEDGIL